VRASRYKEEDFIQIALVNWFKTNYPDFAEDLAHVANQRKCHPLEGKKLQDMGIKKGFSDLEIAVPTIHYNGLYIEIKTKDGRLTKEQKEFIDRKNKRGYFATVARGLEEGKKVITNYLGNNQF